MPYDIHVASALRISIARNKVNYKFWDRFFTDVHVLAFYQESTMYFARDVSSCGRAKYPVDIELYKHVGDANR